MDLVILYRETILPVLPFYELFGRYNITDKGSYYLLNCYKCGKHEAFLYKGSEYITCNRKNNCGHSMSVLALINDGEYPRGREFVDLIKKLCELTGISFPQKDYTPQEIERFAERDRKQKLFLDFNAETVKALHSPEGKDAIEYLTNRGLSSEQIETLSLGFYPSSTFIKEKLQLRGYLPDEISNSGLFRDDWNGRLIIPLKDHSTIGSFVARDLMGKSKESEKYNRMKKGTEYDRTILMGLDKASKDIIVTEGYFDQIALERAGVNNAVAIGGLYITDEHIEKFKKHGIKTVTMLFDNDTAGKEGIIKNIKRHANNDITFYVIDPELMGVAKDPDEFLKKHGPIALTSLLGKKSDSFRYLASAIIKSYQINVTLGDYEKRKALDEALEFEQFIKNKAKQLSVECFWDEFIKLSDISLETLIDYRTAVQKDRNSADLANNLQNITLLAKDGKVSEAQDSIISLSKKVQESFEKTDSFSMPFVASMEKNLFLEEASPMPTLLTKLDQEDGEVVFLPHGIVGSVVGAGGVGKTHWLAQLAISIVTNEKFLGSFTVKKPGPVALILGENSIEDAHRLIRKTICGFFGNKPYNQQTMMRLKKAAELLALQSVTGINASFTDKNGNHTPYYNRLLNHLITTEPEEGWSLIILDPASRFMGLDAEKDNGLATNFISMLENFTQQLKGKPTVLFGHHANKQALNNAKSTDKETQQPLLSLQTISRGASALTDGVRIQINLESEGDRVKMTVAKSNHTKLHKPFLLSKNMYGHLKIEEPKHVQGAKHYNNNKDNDEVNGSDDQPYLKVAQRAIFKGKS